jgi:uncharacterized ParB-like nuclease family protein
MKTRLMRRMAMTDPTIGVGEAAARAPRLEPQDVLALASRLESTFDPGGNLPEDCEEWAEAHADVIHELRGLAECALMDKDEDYSPAARAPLEPLEPALLQLLREAVAEDDAGPNAEYCWWCHADVNGKNGPAQPHLSTCFGVRAKAAIALAAARSALPPLQDVPATTWLCGCGAWNGVNLAACGACARPRSESDITSQYTAHPIKDVIHSEECVCATCRAHSAECRRQDVQRLREAEALQSGFESGRAALPRSGLLDHETVEQLRAARDEATRAPELLAAWREQDRALQDIYGECGEDAPIGCPDDVFRLVKRTLAELRATAARVPEPDLEALKAENERYRYAIHNCHELARREARREQKADDSKSSRWNHVIRLCKQADDDGSLTTSSILRAARAGAEAPPVGEHCHLCGRTHDLLKSCPTPEATRVSPPEAPQ